MDGNVGGRWMELFFIIKLSKTAFESWWKVDLSVVEHMTSSYYVAKVFYLWKIWVDKARLDNKQCFFTLELY